MSISVGDIKASESSSDLIASEFSADEFDVDTIKMLANQYGLEERNYINQKGVRPIALIVDVFSRMTESQIRFLLDEINAYMKLLKQK